MRQEITRRDFMKAAGGMTIAASASLLTGCGGSDGGAPAPGGSGAGGSTGGNPSGGSSGSENPGSGSSSESGAQTEDRIIWKYTHDFSGNAGISDFDKKGKTPAGDLVIPSHTDTGEPVQFIASFTFTDPSTLTSEIPNVTSVTVPATVKSIGRYAFYKAANLKAVSLAGCTSIEEYAFYQCPNLQTVELPNTLDKIGMSVFSGCTKLKYLNIPESLTSVGNSAFHNTALESVVIPGTFEMEYSLFTSCKKLKKVIIEPGVTTLGDFRDCTALEEVTIMPTPNHGLEIKRNCFYNCTALRKIYLPVHTSIYKNAFSSDNGVLPNLTDIYYGGSKEDWETVLRYLQEGNDSLTREGVTVHYNATSME